MWSVWETQLFIPKVYNCISRVPFLVHSEWGGDPWSCQIGLLSLPALQNEGTSFVQLSDKILWHINLYNVPYLPLWVYLNGNESSWVAVKQCSLQEKKVWPQQEMFPLLSSCFSKASVSVLVSIRQCVILGFN